MDDEDPLACVPAAVPASGAKGAGATAVRDKLSGARMCKRAISNSKSKDLQDVSSATPAEIDAPRHITYL